MLSIFQFTVFPGSLLTGLVAGGAIAATARRYSPRRAQTTGGDSAPAMSSDLVLRNIGRTETLPKVRASRMQGGRLALPESVANLTPIDEPALLPANAFVDRLADLTLTQWLDVGQGLVRETETLALRSTSWAIMDATIADRRLGLAAWHVRDAVETIAYVASHAVPKLSRGDRRHFAAAHAAAEDAALAVLTRAYVPAEDFAVLCAPFASTVEKARPDARMRIR